MKKCNTELMKDFRAIHTQVLTLLSEEKQLCTVAYGVGETPLESHYSYEETRKKLAELQKKELLIKSTVARVNATTKVEGFDLTISEALVRLAQLSSNHDQLLELRASSRSPAKAASATAV